MQNLKIKEIIKKSRFKHYEIAEAMGLCDTSFSKMLRKELNDNQVKRVLNAIQTLKMRCNEI